MTDADLPAVLAAGSHLSPMSRTVDRVPNRAETDWLRELREGQIAAAHEEPALLTAAVAAALGDAQPASPTGAGIEGSEALRRHRCHWPHAAAESVGTGGDAAAG